MNALVLRSLLSLLVGIAPTTAVCAQTAPNNTGSLLNYPSGTRIYQGGAIVSPTGTVISPSVTVPGLNGSNNYYYPDGSRITTTSKTVSPAGTFLTPNSPNGGLRNPTVRSTQPLSAPGNPNKGVNQR